MKYDVVIVGAGPAGLSLAAEINDLDTLIVEEHGEIGIPRHCTGVIGQLTKNIISKYSNRVIDKSYRMITFIDDRSRRIIDFKEKLIFHVNRPLLEEVLASIAESKGHRLETGIRAKPYSGLSVKLLDKVVKPDLVVACDGASSLFRKVFFKTTPSYLIGIQVLARIEKPDEESIFVIYSNNVPGFFSWVVPLDFDKAIVGYATSRIFIEPETMFHKISSRVGTRILGVDHRFGGLIPIHLPLVKPVIYSKIVFHGDSVPLIKPYTGGGLFHIFNLSPILARHIERMDLSGYVNVYRKILGKLAIEHSLVNLIRRSRLYHLPMHIVSAMGDLGLLAIGDYDRHYRLFFKAIGLAPVLPFILMYRDMKR